MNEIIKVNEESMTVSARDLHDRLHINSNFTTWFNRMIEYGFSEGTDFFPKMEESTGGRPSMDYVISLNMAKEICMIQRTPEGKQVRQYLISLEQAWNTPELVMARALKIANQQIDHIKEINTQLLADNERMKPKEIFADAITASKTSILVGELAKILKGNGVDIGQKRLFAWLRDKGYLIKRQGTDYNMPTQRSMDLKLFEIKEGSYVDGSGVNKITKTTKVTGKGQEYFINKFLNKEETA